MLVTLRPSSNVHASVPFAERVGLAGKQQLLQRPTITTLQVNVGKRCNQACLHCHVDAGPKRTETMSEEHAERVLHLLAKSPDVKTLDLTGGAPELCTSFRRLVVGARALGLEVIDRCNLSILFEPGMRDLACFLADHQVHVVASLPCYSEGNVDAQRGKGVFDKSIQGLRLLNNLGYAQPGTELVLDLVYNPGGPVLPPNQTELAASYKDSLQSNFGVQFSNLFTLTNLPIHRFAHALEREGTLAAYLRLLEDNFNTSTIEGLMCRSQLSVSWDGYLYDCDFNQMLDMPAQSAGPSSIMQLESLRDYEGTRIQTADHCYGCTAGAGSSCGGAIAPGT